MGGGPTSRALGGGTTARGSRRLRGGMTSFGSTSASRNKEEEDIEENFWGKRYNVKPQPLFVMKSRTAEAEKAKEEVAADPEASSQLNDA